jgi:hypothetical protein
MFDDDTVAVSHLAAIKQGWSDPYRQSVLDQYIGYMDKASEGLVDSPTLDVDALWHEHVLHSTSYVRFCQARYGRYIHHEPRLDDVTAAALSEKLGGRLPGFLNRPARLPGPAGGRFANCGQPHHPPPSPPLPGDDWRSLSRLANCGQPQQPDDEPPPERGTPQSPSLRANCGPPRQPPRGEV